MLDPDALLAVALAAAREAAALVHAGFRTHPAAEHKGRVDLVTAYDRASESLLRERLTSATPYPFVGEELGATAGRGGATWYVDPLDGTTNFVHGHPFYCVSIGLAEARPGAPPAPVLGVVVAPALGIEWTGVVGGGATRAGEPCRVSDASAFSEALLATGFPYDRATNADNNFDAFVYVKRRCQAVRRCGSAAMDLCLVADGTYDGYWERRLRPWDLAGGAAIVLAAGGRVTDFAGGAVDVAQGNTVATNGHLHEALLAALGSVGR